MKTATPGRGLTIVCLLAIAALNTSVARAADERAAAARAATDNFQAALRAELVKGLEEGGPAGAIAVCRDKAPEIAACLGRETGWQVGRTGPLVRNAANAPDAWEAQGLAEFAVRQKAGESLIRMEKGEVVTQPDGKRAYRFLKAIPMGAACVTCHGAAIDTLLMAKIRQLYPEDKAVGFSPGELRGAFTITQPLPD